MSLRECVCEFDLEDCGGTGVIECEGCGGDQCVCSCGGEIACPGCDLCEEHEDDEDDDDFADEEET
jgi:hypothetical protein